MTTRKRKPEAARRKVAAHSAREPKPLRLKMSPYKATQEQIERLAALVPSAHREIVKGIGGVLTRTRRLPTRVRNWQSAARAVVAKRMGKYRMRQYVELMIDPTHPSDTGTALGFGAVGLMFKYYFDGTGMFDGYVYFAPSGGAFFHCMDELPAGTELSIFLVNWSPTVTAVAQTSRGTLDPPSGQTLSPLPGASGIDEPAFRWRVIEPTRGLAGCISVGQMGVAQGVLLVISL